VRCSPVEPVFGHFGGIGHPPDGPRSPYSLLLGLWVRPLCTMAREIRPACRRRAENCTSDRAGRQPVTLLQSHAGPTHPDSDPRRHLGGGPSDLCSTGRTMARMAARPRTRGSAPLRELPPSPPFGALGMQAFVNACLAGPTSEAGGGGPGGDFVRGREAVLSEPYLTGSRGHGSPSRESPSPVPLSATSAPHPNEMGQQPLRVPRRSYEEKTVPGALVTGGLRTSAGL